MTTDSPIATLETIRNDLREILHELTDELALTLNMLTVRGEEAALTNMEEYLTPFSMLQAHVLQLHEAIRNKDLIRVHELIDAWEGRD